MAITPKQASDHAAEAAAFQAQATKHAAEALASFYEPFIDGKLTQQGRFVSRIGGGPDAVVLAGASQPVFAELARRYKAAGWDVSVDETSLRIERAP